MKTTLAVLAALFASTDATTIKSSAQVEATTEALVEAEATSTAAAQYTTGANNLPPYFPYDRKHYWLGWDCNNADDQLCAGVENCGKCVWTTPKPRYKRQWWDDGVHGIGCRCMDDGVAA